MAVYWEVSPLPVEEIHCTLMVFPLSYLTVSSTLTPIPAFMYPSKSYPFFNAIFNNNTMKAFLYLSSSQNQVRYLNCDLGRWGGNFLEKGEGGQGISTNKITFSPPYFPCFWFHLLSLRKKKIPSYYFNYQIYVENSKICPFLPSLSISVNSTPVFWINGTYNCPISISNF